MVTVQLDISVVDEIKDLKTNSRESHNETIKRLIKHYRTCNLARKENE